MSNTETRRQALEEAAAICERLADAASEESPNWEDQVTAYAYREAAKAIRARVEGSQS
jgi:hypothetical protein